MTSHSVVVSLRRPSKMTYIMNSNATGVMLQLESVLSQHKAKANAIRIERVVSSSIVLNTGMV
jgi:hypothetical protein